jgi:hypothetical protein
LLGIGRHGFSLTIAAKGDIAEAFSKVVAECQVLLVVGKGRGILSAFFHAVFAPHDAIFALEKIEMLKSRV